MLEKIKAINWAQKLTSRKFWLVILAAVLLVLNDGLGLGVDAETLTLLVKIILGYVLAEGAADVVSRLKQ